LGARPQHLPAYRRLCALLRQLRSDAKLSQRDLAAKLEKQPSFVHKCEVGDRRIDPVELILWCRACGIAPIQALADLEKQV